jgi:hypothetical protein
MMSEVDKNYEYFMEHLKELYAQYKDKFVVLKDRAVVGAYEDLATAYREASEKYGQGNFSIQECKSDRPEGYVEVFNSACVGF